MNVRMRAATALLLLPVLLGALAGCGAKEKDAEDKGGGQEAAKGGSPRDSNRVVLSPAAVQAAGIGLGIAGPAEIDVALELPGEVKADSSRVLFVRPRFAGVVHAMHKQIGDAVQRGETVASIQSNESLTDYAVPSSIAGRVVARGASVGQNVTQDATLYTIVDLSRVWVDIPIYPHQIGAIRRGQTVRISRSTGGGEVVGAISYVGPLLSEDTRVSVARVVLDNRGGGWDPGLFVNATVVTDRARSAVAVPDAAVVRSGEGAAVFLVHAGGFDLRPVETGRTDGRTTEITRGLASGDSVVTRNAYVLKAELEKEAE